ncbi:RNA-guided pseudouridylation complex pseudouridine synthase subunit Cbf5 [Candidatus Parvarchaeota archaeon]|nr:RNA-guided pseudouridylation complex pseudouridine synthase subunit Cbf5 [Candidatus Parvarchaeota archaeon]
MITKPHQQTDPAFGKPPQQRSVEQLLECGIVYVDKPCGHSSHEISAYVKKILGAGKAGHPGTLDPEVSGVLPVGIGTGTRIIGHLAHDKKEYVGIMRTKKCIDAKSISKLFEKFTGTIKQIPPKMSAVRKRMRDRKVYYLNLAEYEVNDYLFQVGCQAGTYIRTLCSDMGKEIGGAQLHELRRISVGNITEQDCCTLQLLSDAYWEYRQHGREDAIRALVRTPESVIGAKSVVVKDSAVDSVCSGAALCVPGVAAADEGIMAGEEVAIKTLKGELVGFGIASMASSQILHNSAGVAVRTDSVVMKKGIYPKACGAMKK